MCRRCGAPLQSGPDASRVTIPSTMHRHRAVTGGSVVGGPVAGGTIASPPRPAAPAAATSAARSGPADTLLPRASLPGALPRPDNLLPRPVRKAGAPSGVAAPTDRAGRGGRGRARVSPRARVSAYAHAHWRRIVVIAIVAVALTLSLTAVWPVLFQGDANSTPYPAASAARAAIATDLLRTVAGGGRTMYAPGQTYPEVTPAALSSFSYNVPIVGARTVATPGHVSMRLNNAKMLTLATPADAERCVFARDEPAKGKTQFKVVRTTDCRAIAAPTTGWKTR